MLLLLLLLLLLPKRPSTLEGPPMSLVGANQVRIWGAPPLQRERKNMQAASSYSNNSRCLSLAWPLTPKRGGPQTLEKRGKSEMNSKSCSSSNNNNNNSKTSKQSNSSFVFQYRRREKYFFLSSPPSSKHKIISNV